MRFVFFLGLLAATAGANAEGSSSPVRIAYLAFTEGYWQVWTSDRDGHHAHPLTHSRGDKTRVSWFPDRQRLLVNTNQGDVWTVDVASGTERRIPLGIEPVLDAVVAPDGLRLAFSFGIAGSRDGNDIWVARIDGSGRELLTQLPSLQHEPVWSVDGRMLYFLSGSGQQTHDIWRYDLATRKVEQLTNDTLYHFDIAVSPQGSLAYSSNVSGTYEIYLERAGAQPQSLTHDEALDAHPCFLNEDELLFESTVGGVPNIWHLSTITGKRQTVTQTQEGARAPACPYPEGLAP
jgi:TolB protein